MVSGTCVVRITRLLFTLLAKIIWRFLEKTVDFAKKSALELNKRKLLLEQYPYRSLTLV